MSPDLSPEAIQVHDLPYAIKHHLVESRHPVH